MSTGIPLNPDTARRSGGLLVRLERRPPRAESFRLLPRILELRARIRVDELSGLDSLEAVPF